MRPSRFFPVFVGLAIAFTLAARKGAPQTATVPLAPGQCRVERVGPVGTLTFEARCNDVAYLFVVRALTPRPAT